MSYNNIFNKKFVLLGLLALASCKSNYQLVDAQTEPNKKVSADIEQKVEYVNYIAPYKNKIVDVMSEKLSYTSVDLVKRWDQNTNLGDVLADFTLEGAKQWGAKHNIVPNASVLNIGGIRNSIPAGDITVKNVFEVMPFENQLVIVKMKGTDVLDLFNYYVQKKAYNPVSGLYIEVENNTLKKGLVQGKEVDPNQDYYIATSDYLALGGDYMYFFSKGEIISTDIKLRDLFINCFRKNPTIVVPTDKRLILKN